MQFPKRPLELYGRTAEAIIPPAEWRDIISHERCPFLGRRCIKTRKSDPTITIGTCTVGYSHIPIAICPHRFLQDGKIFYDVIPLLANHQPGNDIYVVPEISVPGGDIDFFVLSMGGQNVADYLGLEIQTLDTTGTVWPARQKLIRDLLEHQEELAEDDRSYGMNWKMTAKTILMQIHHKAETLELLKKKLVLVIQDAFYDYIAREFSTTSLVDATSNDPVHFHVYNMVQSASGSFSLDLVKQESTSTVGIEQMLGRKRAAGVSETELLSGVRSRISEQRFQKIM